MYWKQKGHGSTNTHWVTQTVFELLIAQKGLIQCSFTLHITPQNCQQYYDGDPVLV